MIQFYTHYCSKFLCSLQEHILFSNAYTWVWRYGNLFSCWICYILFLDDDIVCIIKWKNSMELYFYFCYNNYCFSKRYLWTNRYFMLLYIFLFCIMIYGGVSWFLAAFLLFLFFCQFFWFYTIYFPPKAEIFFFFWEVWSFTALASFPTCSWFCAQSL